MRVGNRPEATGNSQKLRGVALLLCAMLFAVSWSVEAQERSGKIPRIGFVQRRVAPTPSNPDPLSDAFKRGLRELGYIDGGNIQIEHHYGEGRSDRVPLLIEELVRGNVDVIVAASIQAVRAAKRATHSIPIVMIIQRDPVADGLVKSLARPGGNLTGVTRLTGELSGKRLELLRETIPEISRVGILGGGTDPKESVRAYVSAARALNFTLEPLTLSGPRPDIEGVVQLAVKAGVHAIITNRDALTASFPMRIAELAIKHRIPTMNEDRTYVEAGGLMSYAANDAEQFRRAAVYVDKILKGEKPGELPIEQPTKFELVINLKTAKQISLTIPPHVLARADRVIR